MTRKSIEKRQARERQKRMSERHPLGQGASYRSALHNTRGPEPTTHLAATAGEVARMELDAWTVQFAAKWFATPITETIERIRKPITDTQRALGVTEASRTMFAIRGPSTFYESDRFDHLDVFEHVRRIVQALGGPPVLARMLERRALESIVPNRSSGRMLAWLSRESDDPHVRAFSDAAWANPHVRPWRAWMELVLHLYEEHSRLEHAATMIVENDPKSANECFAQVAVPQSTEVRAALATWLLRQLKTAD